MKRPRRHHADLNELEDAHRHATKAPAQDTEHFPLLFDNPVLPLWSTLPDGTIRKANQRAGKLFGYDPDDLVGREVLSLCAETPAGAARARQLLQRIRSGEHIDEEELEMRRSDGSRFWISLSVMPLLDAQGNLVANQSIGREITARKRAEQALHESKTRNQALLQAIPDALFVVNRDGIYLDFVPAKDFALIQPPDVFLGTSIHETLPAEIAERSMHYVEQVLQTNAPQFFEYRLLINDAWLDFEARLVPYGPDAVLAVIRDVSLHKRAEQALRESEERYRALYENVPLMYFTLDAHGSVQSVNAYGARHLGYRPDELIGQPVLTVFYEADRPAVADQLRGVVQAPGEVARWEYRKVHKDGHLLWVHEAVVAVVGADGQLIVLVACEDVTRRKHVEQQLADQHAQLQKLASELVLAEERTRRRIGRDLHDHIGQILAMAKGQVGALRAAKGANAVKKPLGEIRGLLEQAIQATRSLTFELSSPVLYELGLEAALESLAELMEQRSGLRIRVETDSTPNALTDTTSVVLYRVARELLVNVVKHAQAHTVQVTLRRVGPHVHLHVEDDGIGLDAERFGEGFSQHGGFGLFSIHQQINHIGGRFEIDAAPGRGTRVTVVTPLDTSQTDEPPPGDPP